MRGVGVVAVRGQRTAGVRRPPGGSRWLEVAVHSPLVPHPPLPSPHARRSPTPIESGLLREARRRRFSRVLPGLPGGSPARRAPSWAGPWAAPRQPGRSAGGRGARGGGRCAGGSPPRIAGRGARPSGRRRRRRGGLGGGQARGSRAGGVRPGRQRPPGGGRRSERRRQRAASGRAQRGRRPGTRAAALRPRRAVSSEVRRRAGGCKLGRLGRVGREGPAGGDGPGRARERVPLRAPLVPSAPPRPGRPQAPAPRMHTFLRALAFPGPGLAWGVGRPPRADTGDRGPRALGSTSSPGLRAGVGPSRGRVAGRACLGRIAWDQRAPALGSGRLRSPGRTYCI